MARKLPKPLSRQQLDQLVEHVKNEREKQRKKRSRKLTTKGERINEYLIAIILGAHTGLRISEIVGLRPEGSKCCRARVNEISKRNERGNKTKLKECSKCGKQYSSGDIIRLSEGWDIPPLTPDKINFQTQTIFIESGKGEKDRYVWKPREINRNAADSLPLNVTRRAIQKYVKTKGKELFGREDVHFHVLRHTFATEFLRANPADIKSLQVHLGHSRIDTTSVYSHVSVEDVKQKVQEVF